MLYQRLQKLWQLRILSAMMIGYAGFYLIRQNVFLALRDIQIEFYLDNIEYGFIITVFNILYGLSKGVIGAIGDRCNARYFMTIGLVCACLANLGLIFSTNKHMLIVLCAANALFQSMGWPACARLLTHWFTKKEIGTKWAIWNTSQQLGSLLMYACGALAIHNNNWRLMFLIPAAIGLVIALIIFWRLRDTPESVGLKTINVENTDIKTTNFKEMVREVYTHPLIWLVCWANFFLYFVRMSIIGWAPKFLSEYKGNIKMTAVTHTAGYEIAGMVGGILAGKLSDHFQDRGKVAMFFMLFVTMGVCALWFLPTGTTFLQFLAMLMIGFFISGPQILIGVAAAGFASKKAAGTATGATGVFGYLGASLTGLGLGYILQHKGWDAFFFLLFAACICCSLLLFLTKIFERRG